MNTNNTNIKPYPGNKKNPIKTPPVKNIIASKNNTSTPESKKSKKSSINTASPMKESPTNTDNKEVDPINVNLLSPENMKLSSLNSNTDCGLWNFSKPIPLPDEENKAITAASTTLVADTWFVKAPYLQLILNATLDNLKTPFNVNDIPNNEWVNTILETDRRVDHSLTNEKKRGPKDGQIKMIYFVIRHDINFDITSFVSQFTEILSKSFRDYGKGASRGKLLLDFLNSNIGQYGQFKSMIMKNYRDQEDQAADMLSSKLSHAFHSPGPSFVYNQTLDKTFLDGDIRFILTRYANINQWEDATDEVKAACYRNTKNIPEWSKMF